MDSDPPPPHPHQTSITLKNQWWVILYDQNFYGEGGKGWWMERRVAVKDA